MEGKGLFEALVLLGNKEINDELFAELSYLFERELIKEPHRVQEIELLRQMQDYIEKFEGNL